MTDKDSVIELKFNGRVEPREELIEDGSTLRWWEARIWWECDGEMYDFANVADTPEMAKSLVSESLLRRAAKHYENSRQRGDQKTSRHG